MKELLEAAKNVLEAKEYFMLVQRKYPQFRVTRYSKNAKDVSDKGVPQKFTKAAAEKALDNFDYYGYSMMVPWKAK